MLTVACIFTLIGFYFLYSTSNRADLTFFWTFQKWINNNKILGKYIGLVLLLIGLFSAIYYLGVAAGVFSFIVILMLMASLVVLIEPLRFIKFPVIVLVVIITFLCEINLS